MAIEDAEWEIGIGTFTSPSTLARTAILNSSNSDAIVNWSAGTRSVSIINPAQSIASSNVFMDFIAGTTIAAGDLCVMNAAGKMIVTDADTESSTEGLLGIALEALTTDDVGGFLMYGEHTTTGLTAGSTYWVSPTSGEFTATKPSTSGQFVRLVGYAITTTVLWFNPDNTWVEVP